MPKIWRALARKIDESQMFPDGVALADGYTQAAMERSIIKCTYEAGWKEKIMLEDEVWFCVEVIEEDDGTIR